MVPGVRRSATVGLPVFVARGMRRVGRVEDILLDASGRRVIGLLLAGRGPAAERRVVPWEVVERLGPSAVLVARDVAIAVPPARRERLRDLALRHRRRLGLRLLDAGGADRGTVDDLVFDAATGRVLGYSVSGGLFADLARGQAFLPESAPVEWGEEAALVREWPGAPQPARREAGPEARPASSAARSETR